MNGLDKLVVKTENRPRQRMNNVYEPQKAVVIPATKVEDTLCQRE
jgi:hypothetical protein